MAKWDVEHTDTFGGEANYCWVNKHTIDVGTEGRRAVVRAAKAATGFTGHRCRVTDFGDMIEIRPAGLCQVIFVTWHDSGAD